ncbi:MAG: hypothetical protein ACTSWW_00195, partial [Promethearchaeota archaeon]
IEEQIDRPMNHGALISLCMLICLRLHGASSLYVHPDTLRNLMKICNIRYTLGDLDITPEQLIGVLKGMKTFVERHQYPFSIWNLTHHFNAFSVKEFM